MSNRFEELRDTFNVTGECSPPLPSSDVEKIVAPEALKELLLHAREWHIRKDHCGVFGVNMFAGKDAGGPFYDKEQIMGDAEMVSEWREEHETPNCAQEGWECFAVVSEYDYLFVCVDPADAENFGATRRVVNNCDRDEALTSAPFDNFVERLVEFAELYQKYETDKDDEDEEPPQLINHIVNRRDA
uniref:Knr4/Smi1-like domain-containing protein n=1 Tax=Odontella aurita TaxID=265563 RepID=A0A7S4J307_9STRA|mmetsp:Transcript_36990/g.110778  ORF Transcript_36990/g.110778 Transcript_36990/m.110778 type:complete len:187 (+) Transcript_36990:98-658(+)